MNLTYHKRTSELSIRLSWTEVRQFLSVKGSIVIQNMQKPIRELLNPPGEPPIRLALPCDHDSCSKVKRTLQDAEHKLLGMTGWTKLRWYDGANNGPGAWCGNPPPDFKETCRKEHQYGADLPSLVDGEAALYNLHEIWKKLTPAQKQRVSERQYSCVVGSAEYNRNDDEPAVENASALQRLVAMAWGLELITAEQAAEFLNIEHEALS